MSFDLIDALFALLFAAGGWWSKTIWNAVTEMRKDLGKLEVKLASDYTPNKRFEDVVGRMFQKLDHITDLLNSKADK